MKRNSVQILLTPAQDQFIKIYSSLRGQTMTELVKEALSNLIHGDAEAERIKTVFKDEVELFERYRSREDSRETCRTT